MKKIVLVLLSFLLLLSCKNQQEIIEKPDLLQSRKCPVSFSVSGFTQTTTPLSANLKQTMALDNTPSATLTYYKIHYIVFDSQGNTVSRLEQNYNEKGKLFRIVGGVRKLISSDMQFGSLTDSLQAGSYTIMVAAGGEHSSLNAPLIFNSTANTYTDPLSSATLSQAKFYPDFYGFPMSDAFYYKGDLVVGTSNSVKTITLNRIVGKVKFVIEDAIPAQAIIASFTMSYNNKYVKIATNQAEEQVLATMGISLHGSAGVSNWSTEFLVLNTTTEFTLKAELLGADYKPIVSKVIPIKALVNQQTTVTGKMSAVKPNSFTVTADPNWGTIESTIKY
jgi:hypothetical protein